MTLIYTIPSLEIYSINRLKMYKVVFEAIHHSTVYNSKTLETVNAH